MKGKLARHPATIGMIATAITCLSRTVSRMQISTSFWSERLNLWCKSTRKESLSVSMFWVISIRLSMWISGKRCYWSTLSFACLVTLLDTKNQLQRLSTFWIFASLIGAWLDHRAITNMVQVGAMQPKNHLRGQVSCVLNRLESSRVVQLVGYVGPQRKQLDSFHTRRDGIFLQEIAFGAGAKPPKLRCNNNLQQPDQNK